MDERVVVLLSGGMDSAVLAYWLKREVKQRVYALSVNYGQRHNIELLYAAAIAKDLGITHSTVNLGGLRELLGNNSQTSDDVPVPEGHYADPSMKQTVVPNRNMIMLSIAAGYAITIANPGQVPQIHYAAHAGDHPIYPDCRPEFVSKLSEAMALCHYCPVALCAPFVKFSKADIVKMGATLKVPFELTWSCYKGDQKGHCGKCGTCVERREAFQLAKVPDPTLYKE